MTSYVTGHGSADWKRMQAAAEKTALVVTTMLRNGATCVGKTVMGELDEMLKNQMPMNVLVSYGENTSYGIPVNPQYPCHFPGGSASGSAAAVAARIVDFSLGTDTTGCIRIPASFCGIIGFRPSHGTVSTIGVSPNSQNLDTIGGHPAMIRKLIAASGCLASDPLLSKVPLQKAVYVISKTVETLSGYQAPKHINFGQYIASHVPSLNIFSEDSAGLQNGISTLRALSSVMLLLQRHEFKTNHEDWIRSVKPKLGADVSQRVWGAINTVQENVKGLYKVRMEIGAALKSLLKEVITYQVTIPFGTHDDSPVSISFISSHGSDKFLLDTVLDMYPSIQDVVGTISSSLPLPYINGNVDAPELVKEKGNASYKGKQWNKAASYYTQAIELNKSNATYYCNRAAAFLELGCFQKAEEDCSKAISLDKKNVKAYLRRGAARESLSLHREALQGLATAHQSLTFAVHVHGIHFLVKDFKHGLVLEPQNKAAGEAEKRLIKLIR
ncbi:hypothetical protein SASPL_101223 [Salvia splendens]|uniref:Amidase domain-containing protein n=1 Tax=Salvia splendens TaxID=180675 RepID=A0A8X8YTK4_SALSN|nr:hypothetical protein SASPL_101223 [Salvia splendens]